MACCAAAAAAAASNAQLHTQPTLKHTHLEVYGIKGVPQLLHDLHLNMAAHESMVGMVGMTLADSPAVHGFPL
jgi:hypothetical protein